MPLPLTTALLPVLALTALLAACGQRGPLYLPDEPAPPAPAPAASGAAAEEAEEDEDGDAGEVISNDSTSRDDRRR